ncbi:maleylpyruvate isomerase N-terminal domain-containing protein [Actinoplanes sp. URMC 104]|uniref:maleylpyruvate isomerase N-terminal domain-containing protein n=1 Tax=Actinoplanes sp. URMC 104 TaxID=3423409 RepID=UPI003F1E270F
MEEILEFADRLRLIDERSAAFRAAVAAAPDPGVRVPSCPDWTLADLVQHLGEGRRRWAATVAAGPAEAPPPKPVWASAAPQGREAQLEWLAEGTRQLLAALREAGPGRGVWAWWDEVQSPRTCATVARHQLQEIAVHTYDAQLAAGAPQPLPVEVALDGVEDFLLTCVATTSAWPHEPAVVHYHAAEGRSWRIELSADGARSRRIAPPGADAPPADATAAGTAGELVLWFYGRIPTDALKLDGDRRVFDRLIAWEPA